jgi:hypothetical protein
VTTGLDDGHAFVTGRIGYGRGRGISVTPSGAIPVRPADPYSSGWQLTFSAQAELTVGIPFTRIAASFTFEAGLNIDSNSGAKWFMDPDPEFGGNANKLVNRHANVGGSLTLYSASHETITSSGTCRAH